MVDCLGELGCTRYVDCSVNLWALAIHELPFYWYFSALSPPYTSSEEPVVTLELLT
jgi:hypothetical protein